MPEAKTMLFLMLIGPIWGFFSLLSFVCLLVPFTIGKVLGMTKKPYAAFVMMFVDGDFLH